LRRLFIWLIGIALLVGLYIGYGSLITSANRKAARDAFLDGRLTVEQARAELGDEVDVLQKVKDQKAKENQGKVNP
jgi:hypothetical protein